MAPEPEAHSKGGGQRGGPRRWDGGGPRPARHIPWPEVCFTVHTTKNLLISAFVAAFQTPSVKSHWTLEDDGHGAQALRPGFRQLPGGASMCRSHP
jgi:hypothetical protein